MAKPATRTVKKDGVWQHVAEGSTRRIGTDGTIGQRNSYGNDPRGRKG
jgi:hypothetical protein